MFYLRNSGKSCLFRSFVGFLKNAHRRKGGLRPRCRIIPLLWDTCPLGAKKPLRSEFSWERKNGIEKK